MVLKLELGFSLIKYISSTTYNSWFMLKKWNVFIDNHIFFMYFEVKSINPFSLTDGIRKVWEWPICLPNKPLPNVWIYDQLHPQAQTLTREIYDEQCFGKLHNFIGNYFVSFLFCQTQPWSCQGRGAWVGLGPRRSASSWIHAFIRQTWFGSGLWKRRALIWPGFLSLAELEFGKEDRGNKTRFSILVAH